MAEGGVPTDQLVAYHAEKAKGGCGTVMMFGTAAATPFGIIPARHVVLWDAKCEPGLRKAAAAVKAHGALAISQVTSAGRRTFNLLDQVGHGPSDTSSQLAPDLPRVFTVDEIHQVVEHYAAAAKRLKDCGFDGCDLCFYGEQLVDQFWNPGINKRRDAYGGSLENRMRFSLEVLEAIRGTAGADFIVGARVSGDDRVPGGLEPAEVLEIVRILDRTERLDYFSVLGGTIETYRARGYNIPSNYYAPRTFVDLATVIKQNVTATVIVTGRITTPEEAEDVLASGAADFVGMTRALIADPELPHKASSGHSNEIRRCTGTGEGCIDRLFFGLPITCIQNANIGREAEWSVLRTAKRRRRIAVIGGGPAGMETAQIAAHRGHEVTLFEAEQQLGGAVLSASNAPHWETYRRIVSWREEELRRAGVTVVMDNEVNLEALDAIGADAYIFATGASPRRPYVEGADLPQTYTAAEVLSGRAKLAGKKCLVFDEVGYTTGPKTADYLSSIGYEVHIISAQYSIGETIGPVLRAPLLERMVRSKITMSPLTTLARMRPGIACVRHVLTNEETELDVDNVIFSSGAIANDALYRAFTAIRKAREPATECRLIGDAFLPRQVRHAIADGARVGREL